MFTVKITDGLYKDSLGKLYVNSEGCLMISLYTHTTVLSSGFARTVEASSVNYIHI